LGSSRLRDECRPWAGAKRLPLRRAPASAVAVTILFSLFAAGSVGARLANDGEYGAAGSTAAASYGLEFPAVAAAPEMFPISFVEDPCPVRQLVQVEIAAVVQFEEDRPVSRQRDVPGLRANAG
jgi:hypothetical protein